MSKGFAFPQGPRLSERTAVHEILCDAFADNRSVNWAVRSRAEHVDTLLDYCLGIAERFGGYYVDDTQNAAVVYLLPNRRRFSWFELAVSVRLLRAAGVRRSIELLKRDRYIYDHYPKSRDYVHLWLIGVRTSAQGRGLGTRALDDIKGLSRRSQWPIYLETSAAGNFYRRCNFELFHTWNNGVTGFPLYLYRYEPPREAEPAPVAAGAKPPS